MRTRRPSPEHQEAVARRLAMLSAELAEVREDPPVADPELEPDEPDYAMPLTHTRVSAPLRRVVADGPPATDINGREDDPPWCRGPAAMRRAGSGVACPTRSRTRSGGGWLSVRPSSRWWRCWSPRDLP